MYSYPYDFLSDSGYLQVHTDHVPPVWAFKWSLTHLANGQFGQLFTGNLFYPLDTAVLFNINLLSTAFLSLPLYWATGDFFLCYKVSIYSSFILSSLGMFLLARQLGLDAVASVLAAIIFAFSDYREAISSYGHLVAMQWMPFTLLFIHKYFDHKRSIYLYWAALFFGLQTTACETYFILFSLVVLIFVIILGVQNNAFRLRSFYRDAATPFVLALIPPAFNYFPYWEVSRNFGFKRSIATQVFYGLPISSFLSVPSAKLFQPLNEWFGHSVGGSYPPGYTALMLTFAAVFILRKDVSPLSWMRKFDYFLIVSGTLTLIVWQFETIITEQALYRFPFLYDNPNVVPTAILSPLLLLITLRFCLSGFARSLYAGLKPHKTLFLYTALALFAFLVSMGPAIKTYGQNYLMANPLGIFLYFTFPGLSAIRAISRIGGLIPLGIAITAAISFIMLRDKLASKTMKRMFSILILSLLIFETFPAKGMNKPYRPDELNIPAEYVWLKNNAKGPVLEFPSPCFICDVNYMRWATYHMKPLVNGWGSYQWDGHEKMNQITDLSTLKSLRSLDAFGVRYLLIHKQNSTFPAWAREQIGDFHLVKRFDTALVYENENAQPKFLPDNYWERFSVSYHPVGENFWNLRLTFSSPDKHYVSKKKRVLPVEIRWENGFVQTVEIVFYPTLWRDGDTYSRVIKNSGGRISDIALGAPRTKEH
ncbi:hypothetical protein UR09_00095 [Candidatus Nitromaritima sp. SCGC AAA799-A02]|nr:hypothetical protein UR09_00095 [Candidatus Nitromaritima sp. SCGC AAA799-A02]